MTDQQFKIKIQTLKKAFPIQDNHREDCTQLYRHSKSFGKRIISNSHQGRSNDHMPGRRYGQKFGQAFNNSQYNRLENRNGETLFFLFGCIENGINLQDKPRYHHNGTQGDTHKSKTVRFSVQGHNGEANGHHENADDHELIVLSGKGEFVHV